MLMQAARAACTAGSSELTTGILVIVEAAGRERPAARLDDTLRLLALLAAAGLIVLLLVESEASWLRRLRAWETQDSRPR